MHREAANGGSRANPPLERFNCLIATWPNIDVQNFLIERAPETSTLLRTCVCA